MGFCYEVFRRGRGEAYEILGVRFTDEQWMLLAAVEEELEICIVSEGPASYAQLPEDSDDESTESTTGKPSKPGTGGQYTESLDQAVFGFLISYIKQ